MIDKGHELGNEGRNITIKKGGFKIKFDHVISTKSGYVCGVETKGKVTDDFATPTFKKEKYCGCESFP